MYGFLQHLPITSLSSPSTNSGRVETLRAIYWVEFTKVGKVGFYGFSLVGSKAVRSGK